MTLLHCTFHSKALIPLFTYLKAFFFTELRSTLSHAGISGSTGLLCHTDTVRVVETSSFQRWKVLQAERVFATAVSEASGVLMAGLTCVP